MIDYLEQLLDQVPAEEQEVFSWPQTKARYVATGATGEGKCLEAGELPATERGEQQEQVQAADWETVLKEVTAQVGRQEQSWRRALADRGSTDRGFAGQGFADGGPVLAGLTRRGEQPEQKWESRSATRAEPVRKADLEKDLLELGRAVVRGKTDRETLTWKRKTAHEMAAEGGAAIRRRDEVRMEPRRGLVSRLDAAFERDARRYDGPLGLF